MRIVDFLPAHAIAPAHAATLLELAFLMTAVDGKLAEQEVAAYGELAARLGASADTSRFVATSGKDAIAARVRAIAPSLPADLRETAFTLAIALALVDHDAAASEDELVSVFFEALGLEMARADALAADVRRAFGA